MSALTSLAENAVAALQREVGENLYSVSLYGSAVRGGVIEGVSDLNLLIVLKVSDSAAHEAVARAIGEEPRIAPFVLGLEGFPRSVHAFASKFASIKRWHRVLHGEDVLAQVKIEPGLERFLCEQALRNLRLRLAHAFITRTRHRGYGAFLIPNITPIILRLSEVVRLSGHDVPDEIAARIPVLGRELKVDADTLSDLLGLKAQPKAWREVTAPQWHARVFAALDLTVRWIEVHWSEKP